MKVEILKISEDALTSILDFTEAFHPSIKVKKPSSKIDIRRLLRLYVRRKDPVLKIASCSFLIATPIFVYHEVLQKSNKHLTDLLDIDYSKMVFNVSDDWSEAEKSYAVSAAKKISANQNLFQKNSNFSFRMLPLCSTIKWTMLMNFLECFTFICYKYEHTTSKELRIVCTQMFECLSEKQPEIFNEDILEVFINMKEKQDDHD